MWSNEWLRSKEETKDLATEGFILNSPIVDVERKPEEVLAGCLRQIDRPGPQEIQDRQAVTIGKSATLSSQVFHNWRGL